MSLLLKECRWCGNKFVPARFNEAYCCDECRLDKKRSEDREKAKSRMAWKRSKKVVGKITSNFPTVPEVVAATIEHKRNTGHTISYGKMVNIMERGHV